LTWLTDSSEKHELELNDYLYQNGYDYVICFKEIDAFSSDNPDDTYLDAIENMAENGEDFDITSSFGVCVGADSVSNSYYYLAEKGIYEPLDEYISDEKYAEYYALLPQEYWDSYKYRGEIYGVDNSYSTLYPDYGIAIYNDVLSESGVSPEDFDKPLSQSQDVYKTVYDKTGKSVNFYRTFSTEDIFPANYIVGSVAISDGKAVNAFEENETKEYYETLKSLADEKYITINSDSDILTAGYDIQNRGTDGETIRNENTGITKIYSKTNNLIWNPTNAVGVYSKSKNKDLAVDALFNVIFNKDINNVITYGIEGEDYTLENETAVMKDTDENGISNSVDSTFNNPLISYSCYQCDNEIVSFDYGSMYEKAEKLDGFGFLFDGTDIADTYTKVVNKIMEFNLANADDTDSYLSEFNNQLYEAGLQDILDEVNKQLAEYYES
jgi:putative aldouronate transport system substrate-binding protein